MRLRIAKIGHFSGHRDSIYALAVHSDGEHFYSAGADGWVVEWNKRGEDLGRLIGEVPGAAYSCCLDEDHHRILVGTRKGHLFLIPLNAKKAPRMIEGHEGGVFEIKAFGDGAYLSAGEDGKLLYWDADFEHKREIFRAAGSIRQLIYRPDLQRILLASSDWHIYVLNSQNMKLEYRWKAHNQSVFSMAFSADGRYLYSGGRDAMLRQWDRHNAWELMQELPAHLYHIHSLSLHPGQEQMLSSSLDKTIKLWKVPQLKLLKVIDHARYEAHLNSVNKVLWIGTNEFISCSDDRSIQHFKIEESSE